MTIPLYEGEVPSLTTEQMIEVDRAMMQDMRIELIHMMENAGRNLARVRFFDGSPRGKKVVVLAGTGGNGGGALVCARRLYGWLGPRRTARARTGRHMLAGTRPLARRTPEESVQRRREERELKGCLPIAAQCPCFSNGEARPVHPTLANRSSAWEMAQAAFTRPM
jgi:YjeF-related protein N-terminus